jgi:outer membrane protein assembly factor BamB
VWLSISNWTREESAVTRNPAPAFILVTAVFLCLAGRSRAEDWPQYRADAGRSARTTTDLPAKLTLSWTHTPRHAPQPAWSGRDTRMPFDRVYEPIVAGGMLYYGSSSDGIVYALDATTGELGWTFITGGPVRFAPAFHDGRLFVISDDGHLYCLVGKTGKLVWKKRGGPSDSCVLGNGRMISRWPARGGVAVADGVVYWAAGIWPSEKVYVYASDAKTGETKWCNWEASQIYMPQPHGGANAKSGISAQGYLAVSKDRIVIPTGRGVPAALDRSSGKLVHFHLQKYGHAGGCHITVSEPCYYNAAMAFRLSNGHHDRTFQKKSGWPNAAAPDGLVCVRGRTVCTSPNSAKAAQTICAAPYVGSSLAIAGKSVVSAGRGGRKGEYGVCVIDCGAKKPVWSAEVDAEPLGLAVADERLFVSTTLGTIYCFSGVEGEKKVEQKPRPEAEPYGENAAMGKAAAEILENASGVEGYCLDFGCGDGALAYEIAKRTKLNVVAVDFDSAKVAEARNKLAAAGLLGVRVSVLHGDLKSPLFPQLFANLIVSGRLAAGEDVPRRHAAAYLRPFGGIACLGETGAMKVTKRGSLDGAGTWTHQYCTPGNTLCSTDSVARGPLQMAWFTDFNFQMPNRHGRGHAPLFLDGRLFVQGVNGVRGVDAYNGHTLWVYELPGILKFYDQEHLTGTSATGSNSCVTKDAFYVHDHKICHKLDPATGKVLKKLEPPKYDDGEAGIWGYIACDENILFGSLVNPAHFVRHCYGRSNMKTHFNESMCLFALDPETGKAKWTYKAKESIRHNSIAIGGGHVYLIDRKLAIFDRPGGKRPKEGHVTGTLVCLDADTGKVLWENRDNIWGTMLVLSRKHGLVLMAYQNTRFKLPAEVGGRMATFDYKTGKRKWEIKAGYGSRPMINDDTIIAQPSAWNLLTGKQKAGFKFRRTYGCGSLVGSKNLLLYRSGTMGYSDLRKGTSVLNYGGLRPGCWINIVPAGGMVLMPDATDRCRCSYLIKSSIALQPVPGS